MAKWIPFKDARAAQQALIGQSLQRAFKVSKADINVKARTVRMAITSDEPVLHWVSGRGACYVVLDHDSKSINLERLQFGACFDENHDPDRRLGRMRDGVTDGHVLRVNTRFSSRPYANEIFGEVQEDLEHGDSPGTSAWFSVERIAPKIEGYIDEFPIVRATRWTLLSGTLASTEADTRSGIGRTHRAAAPDAEECDAQTADDCEGTDCPVHAGRTQRRRSTTMRCNARSAEECETDNCQEHAGQRRAEPPPPLTPEQLIAQRQAEYTGWARVFSDTPEETAAFTQLARDYGRDAEMNLDMFKAAIEKAKTAARAAAVNTATPPSQSGVIVPGRRTHSLRVFKGEGGDLRAYRFMMAFMANACRSVPGADKIPTIGRAYNYAKDHGLLQRTEGQSEGINEDGGFTVTEEWSPETIDLHEEFGVIRRYAKIEPMASEAKNIRRREGGLRFHPAGEGEEVEIEKKKWGGNKLVAKKWLCLANITSELNEDSAVNQADDLAYEMTLAQALLEDDLGFLADGTGSEQSETGYQGVVGIIPKLLNVKLASGAAATPAQTAGLLVANGNPTKPEQVPLVLGDLRMGTLLGDRSALTITVSEHSSFRNDTIDLKGRIRNDFIAHSVGNADATASKRKAGPIVALATDDWDAITEDDLNALMGMLPRFPGIRPVFFCHQTFYFTVLRKILMALGGPQDLAGAGPFRFGGYPVEFCQNLPSAEVA